MRFIPLSFLHTEEESPDASSGQNEKKRRDPDNPNGDVDPSCVLLLAALKNYLLHPNTFRKFRDQYLLKTSAGRQFVDVYYSHSAEIKQLARRHRKIRKILLYLFYQAQLMLNGRSRLKFVHFRKALVLRSLLLTYSSAALKKDITGLFQQNRFSDLSLPSGRLQL